MWLADALVRSTRIASVSMLSILYARDGSALQGDPVQLAVEVASNLRRCRWRGLVATPLHTSTLHNLES